MGITVQGYRPLIAAYRSGIRFGSTLTIGRLECNMTPAEIEGLFREQRCDPVGGNETIRRECVTRFSEPCFRLLGAEEVASLDASTFEGADLIHDLNQPVSEEWHGRYDVVFDGGSLEHVFDYPTALGSCLQMVREGGYFIAQTPSNNWCGHGFYQFSAELFFRTLNEANGFRVTRMLAMEAFDGGAFYEVTDPADLKTRALLVNRQRILLHVEARKERTVERLFAAAPQQSDYAVRWEASAASGGMEQPKIEKRPRRKAARAGLLRTVGRINRRLGSWLSRLDAARRNRRHRFGRRPDVYRRTRL